MFMSESYMQEVPLKRLMVLVLCAWILIPAAAFAEGSFVDGSVLKKGFQGPEARLLQQSLKMAGFFDAVETSDNFGDATEKSLKEFQTSVNITADGVAGNETISRLVEKGYTPVLSQAVYKPDNTYGDLPALQAALHSEGFFKSPFGSRYDSETMDAVMKFQAKYGLTPDGIAGKGTINKLIELGYIYSPPDTDSVSRGTGKRVGIPINWYDIKPKFSAGKTILTVEDFLTGATFRVQVSYCATVHADIETLTKQDSETIKNLWGGFSWDRRPVLIHFNGEIYAASMNGLPHAGVDSKPAGTTVSGRSAGYGTGYNFDDIKGNGIDGHFCLHFLGSRTHGGNSLDEKHQANIRIAAGQ